MRTTKTITFAPRSPLGLVPRSIAFASNAGRPAFEMLDRCGRAWAVPPKVGVRNGYQLMSGHPRPGFLVFTELNMFIDAPAAGPSRSDRAAPSVPPWRKLGVPLPESGRMGELERAAEFHSALQRPITSEAMPQTSGKPRGERAAVHEVVTRIVSAGACHGFSFTQGGVLRYPHQGVWLLGALARVLEISGDISPLHPYVAVLVHADGSVTMRNSALRPACGTVVGSCFSEADGAVLRINGQLELEVSTGLAIMREGLHELGQVAGQLAAAPFPRERMEAVVDLLLPLPDGPADRSWHARSRERVIALFDAGMGLPPGEARSCWTALLAWGAWVDVHRNTHAIVGTRVDEMRLLSTWVGRAAALKQRALPAILGQAHVAGVTAATRA